jgi:ectoine hydroxylase-related dioxygenase (phytanoyl-CoA dioxygenase family)
VQRPAKQEQVFRDIADHPNLQSAMAQLLGGPVERFTDQALIKNKTVRGESFYHQDSEYWHIPPEQGANAWIALDEVDREAIALAILPGTHKIWEIIPHEAYYDEPSLHNAQTGQAFKRYRIPFAQIDFSKEVLLPMSPGDAAFFSNYTWHRAEPNLSGSHKAAYAIAYQLRKE